MHNLFLFITGLSGALAVGLGALGSHFLKHKISAEQILVFDKAVLYHFFHSLALLALTSLMFKIKSRALIASGFSFILGILLFSGSLYLLSTRELLAIESWNFLGPLTPVGGVFFILGWIFLAVGAFRT